MANTRFITENGLSVTSGNAEFAQAAQFNANVTVSGDLLYVGGNLYVQGTQVLIGGQEYATDLLATIPNLKLGNSTYQWDAFLDNTKVYGDLIPVGNTILLGDSTNRWVISGNTLNISTTSTLTGAVTLSNTISVTGNATLSNTLSVTGNTVLSNTIAVTGNATFANIMAITGAVTLSNTINVTGAATLSNTINVTGAATLGNTLSVTNTATFSNTTSHIGAATFSNTVGITGAATLSNTLGVAGLTTLSSNLSVTGNTVLTGAASLSNTISVTGAATLSNTLGVTGTTTLSNTLGVTGAATFSNTVGVTGVTTLSNTLGVTGAATLSNTISVTGNATFSNAVIITGNAVLSNTLSVTGAANALNTLGVTGAATLSNTLGVTGAATLSNTLGVTGAVTFSNTVAVTGAATLSNTLVVTGNSNFRSGLLFVDAFNVRVGIGNGAPDTGLTVGSAANIAGAVQLGNTFGAIGATTLSNTINVTGAATLANTIAVTGAATLSNTLGVTGAATLANSLGVTGSTSLSNTLTVTGNATFSNTLAVTGAANLSSTLGVTGAATLSNTINVTGAATLGNTLSVTNTATFSNTTSHIGAATFSNTVGVTGAATFSNTIAVTGAATLSSNLSVTGNTVLTGAATLSNTLNVTGATSLSNTLGVTGAATFANTVGVTGAVTLSNTISVTGNATFSNDVLISGNLIVSGTTTYVNTATLNIADNIITLNADLPVITAPTENAGVEVNRGSAANVSLRWNETNDYWDITEDGTNYYRLATQGATNTSFDFGVLFIDSVNNRVGINNTAPGVALRVGGAADITLTANVQGNANVGGTLGVTGATTLASTLSVTGAANALSTLGVTGATTLANTLSVTGAANALSTLGVNGATTLAGTLAVTGNSTFSANARIEGRLTVNTGGISFGYTAYPIYQTNLDFGADVAGTWRKIASVSLQNAQYSTAGYRIQLVVTNANHATLQSARDAEEMVYYVACNRSNDTVLDTPDACYVYGPSDHVRAVKTSTGNYEIQVQNKFQYVEYQVVIQCYIQNGNANAATFFDGSTAGSAGTAQYNATSSSNNAVWVQVLRVGNSTTNSLVNSSSLSIPSVFTTNSTITNAAANVQLTPSATAGYVGIGRAPTATVKLAVNSQFSTDGSTIGAYNDYSIANTALTAARTYQGLNTQFTNRGQQKDSGGTTTYNSTGYGVFATAYNGDPTTGGDAQIYDIYGAYVTARNYANGSSANTVTVGYGLSSLYNSSGNGVTTTAFGIRSEVAAANSSITGNIATAYGVRSIITSNTSMTITDGYLFSGTFNGSTTTNKFGVYLTGESNNYFSSNVYVGNVLTTIGLANLAGNLNTPTVNATSNLNVGTWGTTNGVNITNTQIIVGNNTGYGILAVGSGGGILTLQNQVGNTYSNATIQLAIQSGNAASIELGGTSGAFIDFKTPFADDYDTRLISNNTGFYIIGGSATSANLVEIQSANVNIDSGVLYVDATNNRVGVNTTTPGVPFEVKGGGGTTSALSLVHPTDLSFVRIVPSASAGAYNPTVAVGDHLLYFSNGTSNYGNLVIAPWSSVSFGMKFNTIGNTITLTANSINMDSGVLYVDGLNNRVGINNTAPGVALRVTGDVDVSATANIQGVLHARSGAISYTQLTVPGSSSSTGEGGQIILGYGNNLAAAITGQQNYTFNIDVVGGNTGSTPVLRMFTQHGDGTVTNFAAFANTGRIHLGSASEQTETTVKITGTANVTQLLNASGNLNAPVVNATSNLNVGQYGTSNGINAQNTFVVVGNTAAYVNTTYTGISAVNATFTTNVFPTYVATQTVNAAANLNVGQYGTSNGINAQNTFAVIGNTAAYVNTTALGISVVNATFTTNVFPTYVATQTVNAAANLNVGQFGTTNGVNVQNTVIVVGNSTANATTSYNLLQVANSTGTSNLTPTTLAVSTFLTVNSTTINAAANLAMAAYTEKMASYTIAANGTQDLDLKLASVFKVSVGAFTANVRFINPPASGTAVSATLILQYTGTSVLTLQGNTAAGAAGTLKYAYDSAPTLTQTTGKSDIISAVTYDGGATYIIAPSFMNFTT